LSSKTAARKAYGVKLRTPKGIDLIKQLVTKVDVVVENFAPGVISEMGLGYEVLKSLNPHVVMCSISALGQTGPLAMTPGLISWDRPMRT